MNQQPKAVTRSVIAGCGSALPQRVMTNADMSKVVDTNDEWIVERTGIKARHIAGEGETTRSLGTEAARRALAHAGLDAGEVDLIILATSTPDQTFPATATLIQADLGITRGAAFDVQAVCSGFVYALSVADAMLKTGQANCALVIGSETFSRILDWTDRTTCVLFGDGAGAVVLKAETHPDSPDSPGIMVTRIRSDGRYHDKLYVDGGPSTTRTVGHLRMEGREVFKHAVGMITDVVVDAFARANVGVDDLDWFVPHQANRRIIDASAEKLGIASQKVVTTVHLHGNTSAASIPLALDAAVQDGRIKRGDLVMIEAIGGGFTWGAALIRW